MKTFLIIVCIILLAGVSATSAKKELLNRSFVYKQFDSRHGLTSNQVSHIIQDKKGYLWISYWRGFSRFDGKQFKNYRDTDGLFASSSYEAIEFLPNNFLVQHVKGISIFKPEGQSLKIAFPDSIRGLRIGKSVVQHDQFWIFNCLDHSGKMCHLNYNGQWNRVNQVGNDSIFHVLKVTDKRDFLFTKKAVFRLENAKIKLFANLKRNYSGFNNDQNNQCWGFSVSDSQFYILKLNDSSITETPTGIFAPNMNSKKNTKKFVVLPYSSGIVYFTNNYELFRTTKTERKSLGRSFSLIRDLLIDQERNLWVATEEGIFNFFRLDFERIKLTQTDKSDMIWSIASFGDERIVAGRFGFGFVELMDSVWQPVAMNYNTDRASGMEPFSPFMGALTTKNKEAWFPVWKGLIKFDRNGNILQIPLKTTPEHLSVDPKSPDTIYAAATDGMLIIDPNGRIRFKDRLYGFSRIQNESIVKDKFNRFWLGSSQGPLQILHKNEVLSQADTPRLHSVISSKRDSEGNLWFGTDQGLYYYNYQTFRQILPKIITESIDLLVNYNDSIMIGIGFQKIVLIDYKKKDFQYYIHADDFQGIMQNTRLIDRDGFLWLSTTYELIRFNPMKLIQEYKHEIPVPIISAVDYSNNNIQWISAEKNNTFGFYENNLRFTYQAVSFTNQDLLTFRTYLENYNSWGTPTQQNEVYYTNLKPGKYRLAVQCSVDGQNWSATSFSQPIEIKAEWHQLEWVRLTIILLLLICIFLITYLINSAENKRSIRKLTEQRKLNQLQLQLVHSKQIPHFSGNALANIEHFIFNTDFKQANKFLSLFSKYLNQTMQFADQPAMPLKHELEQARTYLELEVMRFEHMFTYEIIVDQTIDLNHKIPNMLLHTWVENAVKHGLRHKTSGGKIIIEVKQQNDMIILTVEDNGIGRKKAKQMGTSGTGRGLKIILEQIEIHNQFNVNKMSFSIVDQVDSFGTPRGTKMILFVPVNYSFDV